MRDFKKLHVWKKSHNLTLDIYKLTSAFPKEELYGLTSQMRSSSSSVPTNIAEGYGRQTQAQLAQFLNIAGGSASELEYQLILSKDLKFIDIKDFNHLTNNVTEVKRMLSSLHQKVSANS